MVPDSPERSQTQPWKFWRKLSTRRTDKKSRASTKSPGSNSRGRQADWTVPGGLVPGEGAGDGEGDAGLLVTSGSLPDVVDKTVFRRSSSLKAPPKPPRLFLFRSSSINNPRSSLDGGSARNSLVGAGGGGGGGGGDFGVDVLADTEPIYVNSAFGAGLQTGLSANDRVIPPIVGNNNNNNNNNNIKELNVHGMNDRNSMNADNNQSAVVAHKMHHNGTLPRNAKTCTSAAITTTTTTTRYNTLPASHRHTHNNNNQRLKSTAAGDVRKKSGGRPRRKSSERCSVSRHRHVMNSAVELLCQRLHPSPLLDDLLAAGVLTDMDVQAFRGHPDRKLICESLANIVGEGDYQHFLAFIEVLRANGGHEEVVHVLDAMRDLDRLIHEAACRPDSREPEDDVHMLADEKMIAYEVGYLAADGVTLKPIVELERVRPADRRASKRMSRLSAFSTTVTDASEGVSDGAKNGDVTTSGGASPSGPVKMSACVTGHNLSGERALALADVIRRHDCLLELRIGKTQLCSDDVSAICRALPHSLSLVSLDVRLNTLDLTSAAAVGEMLRHTRALRQLNLSSTGLDVAGCGAVLGALASNRTLTELDLSFLDVGDAVCEFVRDMLKANSCLQKLRLRSNNFSAAGCLALAEGLSRNRSLLELDLSRNCVGDTGLEALARYLPDSALTELGLENCGLTASACDALAQMISGSKRLRVLDLSVNFIGDQGVFRLAAALERSSVLQTVGLNMCGVTNDGFSKLLDALEKNASISLLKLCYNRLGREHQNPAATSDNLRYRLRIVTSSKPKLKILLWGNSFDEA